MRLLIRGLEAAKLNAHVLCVSKVLPIDQADRNSRASASDIRNLRMLSHCGEQR